MEARLGDTQRVNFISIQASAVSERRAHSLIHFVSVFLVSRLMPKASVVWNCDSVPTGVWGSRIAELCTVRVIEPPSEIFGRRLDHPAHQSDVLRLKKLIDEGGIYLDSDLWVLQDLSKFGRCECVLGMQGQSYGLCNAVISAKANSEFLRIWLNEYMDFDGGHWDQHSIRRPMRIARANPHLIHLQPEEAFFWPLFNDPMAAFCETKTEYFKHKLNEIWSGNGRIDRRLRSTLGLFLGDPGLRAHSLRSAESLQKLRRSDAIHLWERLWGKQFLSQVDRDWFVRSPSPLAVRVREVLGADGLKELERWLE